MAEHVVIVGGGFGGLYAAKRLSKSSVHLTLVDRHNFHLFQPLLYQVATGGLSPANIASPLRTILSPKTEILLAEVVNIDVTRHRLILKEGELTYDTLIVAAGATHSYFGHDEWEQDAPPLKSIDDATTMRAKVFSAFEAAEREQEPQAKAAWQTFVVVGGGPTGVELAGALGEVTRFTLRHNFQHIDPSSARIILVENEDQILSEYPKDLQQQARKALTKLGITIQTGGKVADIKAGYVAIKEKDQDRQIATHTVLWAAGVRAVPLGRIIADAAGAEVDKQGRIKVQPDLTLPNHPEIFVIGDLADFTHQTGKSLPGVAQVAIQQGKYVADLISRRQKGERLPPFHYRDLGSMTTIGRASAVANIGPVHLHGYIGWLVWLFVHLINLIAFQNRMLVMFQLGYAYFTRNRSARRIIEPENAVAAPKVQMPD